MQTLDAIWKVFFRRAIGRQTPHCNPSLQLAERDGVLQDHAAMCVTTSGTGMFHGARSMPRASTAAQFRLPPLMEYRVPTCCTLHNTRAHLLTTPFWVQQRSWSWCKDSQAVVARRGAMDTILIFLSAHLFATQEVPNSPWW